MGRTHSSFVAPFPHKKSKNRPIIRKIGTSSRFRASCASSRLTFLAYYYSIGPDGTIKTLGAFPALIWDERCSYMSRVFRVRVTVHWERIDNSNALKVRQMEFSCLLSFYMTRWNNKDPCTLSRAHLGRTLCPFVVKNRKRLGLGSLFLC